MKILIVNGPNLNLLGSREPQIYGDISMETCLEDLRQKYSAVQIDFFQSNSEGEIIDRLQKDNFEYLIINSGAYSHYSYAIADCLANIKLPKIEVHISNIYRREEFRHQSVTGACCDAVLSGFGLNGYDLAIKYLNERLI